MYPIGHVAISYLVIKPLSRQQPSFAEFAALTGGTLFPSVSNVALLQVNLPGLHHYWSHSPLLLVPLGIIGVLGLLTNVPFRRVPLFFALGVLSHLVVDILFAFPLVYLANSVDDVGGSWFFPWRPFLIRYNGAGFSIQPWELIIEGVLLVSVLLLWKRRDLALYGAVVAVGTAFWVGYGL